MLAESSTPAVPTVLLQLHLIGHNVTALKLHKALETTVEVSAEVLQFETSFLSQERYSATVRVSELHVPLLWSWAGRSLSHGVTLETLHSVDHDATAALTPAITRVLEVHILPHSCGQSEHILAAFSRCP